MNILFSWTGVTSYMADCWRELQSAPGVHLKIIIESAASGSDFAAAETLKGLDYELVEKRDAASCAIATFSSDFKPDVLFVGGWRSVTTRRTLERYQSAARIFCLDMPWRWSFRCIAARWILRDFLKQFAAVYVPGKLAARYARWLGFSPSKIFEKLYAVKTSQTSQPSQTSRPPAFLYLGRFAKEKRVDLIEKAYARYRELGGTWTIDYYGQGGKFIQAADIPQVYAEHSCLLMASEFDPWPLVILEAKMAGLEVIASDRCGNAAELGAQVVPFGNVESMAQAMLQISQAPSTLSTPTTLSTFSTLAWSERTLDIARRIVKERQMDGMLVVDGLLRQHGLIAADEVWVHGMWTPDKWIKCLKAKLSGKKLVRMTHGSLSPIYLEHRGKWKKRFVKPIEKLLFALSDRVVVTGPWEEKWARDWGLVRNLETIDLKRFFKFDTEKAEIKIAAIRSSSEDTPLKVLYLGRNHPLKGLDVLKSLPNIELRVVENHCGEELERDWEWCDVLILPTLSENFGLVVAEALERGIPAITTDGAPAWETQPGVIYLKGYCAASPEARADLLRTACNSKP